MPAAPARPAPAPDGALDPNVWKIVAVAVTGVIMTQLDSTVVTVSLDRLSSDLNSSLATISWVTSGYLLALALSLPLNGWLMDRIGARRLYIWCFAAFTLASALCGLATSAPMLITARVMQGLVGGILAPMAQTVMARAAGRHFARVFGYSAMASVLAPLLGPALAGLILQHGSWRWLFLINLPVGALAILLSVLFLPRDDGAVTRRRLDLVGLALLSPGLALFLFGAGDLTAPSGMAALGLALALLAGFVIWARARQGQALLDLRLFSGQTFSAAALTQFLSNGAAFATQMAIPIFLMRQAGLSPVQAGLLMAPMGLGSLVTYPFLTRATGRFGLRRTCLWGAGLALASTLGLVGLAGFGFSLPVFVLLVFLRGVGGSTVGLPSITVAYSGIPSAELPMAATTLNIVMRLGGPTLTAVFAIFLDWRLGAGPLATAFTLTFAGLCLVQVALLASALRLPLRADSAPLPAD